MLKQIEEFNLSQKMKLENLFREISEEGSQNVVVRKILLIINNYLPFYTFRNMI
jgi:hypothetical protein